MVGPICQLLGLAQSASTEVNGSKVGPRGPLVSDPGVGPRRHVGRRREGTPASPYTAASLGRGRNSATGVRFTRAWSRSNGQDDPRRMVVVVRPEMAGNGIGGELSGGRSSGLHGHGDGRHGKARRGALRGPGSARSTRGPSVRAEELGVREDEGGQAGRGRRGRAVGARAGEGRAGARAWTGAAGRVWARRSASGAAVTERRGAGDGGRWPHRGRQGHGSGVEGETGATAMPCRGAGRRGGGGGRPARQYSGEARARGRSATGSSASSSIPIGGVHIFIGRGS